MWVQGWVDRVDAAPRVVRRRPECVAPGRSDDCEHVPATAQASDVQTLITNTNSLRASVGLPPLQLDPQLSGLAQEWADHMASTNTLEHPPDIEGPVSQPWTLVGDNMVIAMTRRRGVGRPSRQPDPLQQPHQPSIHPLRCRRGAHPFGGALRASMVQSRGRVPGRRGADRRGTDRRRRR